MEQTKEKRVSKSVAENRRRLEVIFGGSFDMVMRPLVATSGQAILVVFSDGLVNKTVVAEDIVRPFLGYSFVRGEFCPQELQSIRKQLLSAVDIKPEPLLEQAAGRCLQGDTAVFIEGFDRALIIQTRGWQSRGISPPTSQQSVRGPKEAFTETLLFNVAMLRRKIRSPRLKLRMLRMGTTSRTDVCVAYVEGAAKEELICEVCRRIGAAEAAYVLESGHVEQLVEDAPGSLFATVGNSEKPDVVAAKLLKGRVAILVDGTPFVLTVPCLFTETFRAAEDYYMRPFYANFVRLLRVVAWLLAVLLPGLYVALLTYHQAMIPGELLATLIGAAQGVPLPAGGEMLLMLLLYELLREALLRLPTALGSSVGIVGVLIIGDAAVAVGLISAPAVVVAALTYISSALVVGAYESIALLRIGLLALGAAFGLHGLLIGLFITLAHLCSLTSFGCPYMLPLAPVRLRALGDSLVRMRTKNLLKKDGM